MASQALALALALVCRHQSGSTAHIEQHRKLKYLQLKKTIKDKLILSLSFDICWASLTQLTAQYPKFHDNPLIRILVTLLTKKWNETVTQKRHIYIQIYIEPKSSNESEFTGKTLRDSLCLTRQSAMLSS